MKSVFCVNFEYNARESDLERLFRNYGKVERVDMKAGFAFVYMEDEREADDAIRALDRFEIGHKGRRLRVEWTKVGNTTIIFRVYYMNDRASAARSSGSRRSSSGTRLSKTLFVINFVHRALGLVTWRDTLSRMERLLMLGSEGILHLSNMSRKKMLPEH